MSGSIIFASIWVLIGTAVAFLPMRYQYPPGICLLIAAPIGLGWIAVDHGVWIAAAGLAGFLSMFRRPLGYFVSRAIGGNPEVPE